LLLGIDLIRNILFFTLAYFATCGVCLSETSPGAPATKPNFLIILTDDQRPDTMHMMPKTKERIFGQGCEFKKAYVTTPLCCPSRSSILTGQYASRHGVTHNSAPLKVPTFVESLKNDGGYYTGLIGKYLNSSNGLPRKEYDFWVSQDGGNALYYNPRLNVNGSWQRTKGYSTYLFRDYALEFLQRASQQDKPFYLYLSLHAPHRPSLPAPEDSSEATLRSRCKELLGEHRSKAEVKGIKYSQGFSTKGLGLCRHLLTLSAVDRAIDEILTNLAERHLLDNTVIFFLSDNSVHYGEHDFWGKGTFYEESIRVPFAVRYPKLIHPQISEKLVSNIDIAPTIFSLAGL